MIGKDAFACRKAAQGIRRIVFVCAVNLFLFGAPGNVQAASVSAQEGASPLLEKCLKRADDLPDIAAAESDVWIKKGGGNEAHLCRAFAQSNRGMHVDAAREFWSLASLYRKTDAARTVMMDNLAGQEFMRAKDMKNAEARFTESIKIAPHDLTALIGHAEVLMEMERYWDALDDLNHALKLAPDNVDALRQRGRAWAQLGNDKNAEEDFDRVEVLTHAPLPE